MDEISHFFGIFLAAVVTGPAALANPARPSVNRQSPHAASVVNNTKIYEVPFLRMLQENQRIIYRISGSYYKNRMDRQDLYQDIVGELWESFPTYNGDSKISTWLYTVALRLAMRRYRHRIRVKIESWEVLPDMPAQEAAGFEMDDAMYSRFHKLDKRDKAILMLMMEGYSNKDIGEALIIRAGTVNTRISRLKKMVGEW